MESFKSILFIATTCAVAAACAPSPQVPSEDEAVAEFLEVFNEFYETYGASDAGFVDYYTTDVVSMDNTGAVEIGSASYREAWEENFREYEIEYLEYTQPKLIYSPDQIVSYNDYDERLVSLDGADTIVARGTWIGVWQKIEGEWRVVMNTFHVPPEDEAGDQ